MATSALRGSARFTYEHPDTGATTHLLALPLSPVGDLRPLKRRSRYHWWAENEIDDEVVVVGPGVSEVEAVIRCDDEPAALQEMLRVALEEKVTLTYQKTAAGDEFPVRVVSIPGAGSDEIPLAPDRERHGFGEWEVAVVLRRIDGGTLDGVFS